VVEGFDYVVVGAGAAGCVLAARLSQDTSARVLLLEAGGLVRTRAMTVPGAWPDNLGSAADWGELALAQADAGPVPYPRGRAVGGSSAINAMAHVRGHRAVYDEWAAGGAPGWDFPGLLPFFRRSEHAPGRDPALRGTAGPVRVAPAAEADRHPVARGFAAALAEIGCLPADDLSGHQQDGVGWADLAICGGQRVSAADAYLRPVLARPNLTIHAGCLVTRLVVRRGRCTGVSYLRDGSPVQVQAAGEVIVCAGAVGSPHLLMVSGIGPARHLRAHGISPVADLAGVGQNLQDHPLVMVSCATAAPLPASRYNHGEVYAAVRTGLAGAWPDLQLLPILLPLAPPRCPPPAAGYVLAAAVVAPDSRGTVRLASGDPGQAPLIDPGFLTEPGDTDRLMAGLRLIRQACARPALRATMRAEVWPGPGVTSSAALRHYIRRTVGSYYHPAGTCRMGTGNDAVADPQLRVRGISGLRVADASVMPVIPNAPLAATVYAIAERAADLIAGPPGT
jgi:choline dehydrogenase